MIAGLPDQPPVARCGTQTSNRCSRRSFLRRSLGLMAACGVAGSVAGGLAGCASTTTSVLDRIGTPTAAPPLIPSQRITTENAARIKRLAALDAKNHRVRGVTWSPDARLVVSGANPEVALWDAATGKRLATLNGHTSQVYSLAWSPANHLLASADGDGTVRIWDTQQGRSIQKLQGGSLLFSVTWSPDGRQIAAGTSDGSVLLWNAESGKQLAHWDGPEHHSHGGGYPFAVWGISWSPDGRQIVSTRYDDLVLIWDVATGRSRVIPKTDFQPNTVAWSPDGRQFAVTDDQGKVVLWDGATATRGASFQRQDDAGWSYGLTWSPDGSMVASSRESGIVQVWDARSGNELAQLEGHLNAVWGLAWSPDGMRLASASDDGSVFLWGVR